ncbi:MAG TPA: hypothetical protein VIL74_24725 [Pyrinomonadaceae bacterium]|jgi:hypothetical protein
MKLLETILAVACIIIAIYNFDFYNLNRTIVSILLLMQAGMILVPDEKVKKFLRHASVGLAVFLIMKILMGY